MSDGLNAPLNAPPGLGGVVGSQAGSTGVDIAHIVIVYGTSGTGIFVYSGTPASGSLIVSIAAAAGTDPYGNAYEQGVTTYVTVGGHKLALQVGSTSFGGSTFAGFWTSDLTSPSFSPPGFVMPSADSSGCLAEVFSGQANSGSQAASVQVADSTESGVTGGSILLASGQTTLVNGGVPIPATPPAATAAAIIASLTGIGIYS